MFALRFTLVLFVIFRLLFPSGVLAQQDRLVRDAQQDLRLIIGRNAQAIRGGQLQLLQTPALVDEDFRRQAISTLSDRKKSEFGFPVWTVPTMANAQGQFGAFFKTRVVMFNPTTLSFNVAARLYGPNGVVETRQTDLPANTFKSWDDFLGTGFGYSGAGGVEFDSWFIPVGGSDDFDFFLTAEVYTDSPNGRYKTTVVNGLRPDTLTGLRRAVSIGINVSANERTNLGVLNDSSITAVVHGEVYSAGRQLLETVTFNIVPRGWAQLPINSAVTNGTVEWKTNALIYAWAVGVDNRSNDGTLSYPSYYLSP